MHAPEFPLAGYAMQADKFRVPGRSFSFPQRSARQGNPSAPDETPQDVHLRPGHFRGTRIRVACAPPLLKFLHSEQHLLYLPVVADGAASPESGFRVFPER